MGVLNRMIKEKGSNREGKSAATCKNEKQVRIREEEQRSSNFGIERSSDFSLTWIGSGLGDASLYIVMSLMTKLD
jgi:hypothetical protein